jgi:hypothetical protein
MFSASLKAGAALVILSAGGYPAFAQKQAQDLSATASAATKIVTVKTTPERVAFVQQQSDSKMSPLPDTGNLAMLITGLCLAGVAARRHKVAA